MHGQRLIYSISIETLKMNFLTRGGIFMKGYSTESGYMGLVEGRYMLFASEEDYRDYMED